MLFKKLPLDGSVEAEYADGYVLSETNHKDISPYNPQENVFRAILHKDPEEQHGRMVRFSVYYLNKRYDVDWTTLPENAKPIRLKDMTRSAVNGQWINEPEIQKIRFGYEYIEDDQNIEEIMELV